MSKQITAVSIVGIALLFYLCAIAGAQDYYSQSRQLNKKIAEQLAYTYYQAGEYGKAYEEYQHIVEENPQDSEVRYNAGCMAALAGWYKQAVTLFEQVSAQASEQALRRDAYFNLAVIYGKYRGEIPKALYYYRLYQKEL